MQISHWKILSKGETNKVKQHFLICLFFFSQLILKLEIHRMKRNKNFKNEPLIYSIRLDRCLKSFFIEIYDFQRNQNISNNVFINLCIQRKAYSKDRFNTIILKISIHRIQFNFINWTIKVIVNHSIILKNTVNLDNVITGMTDRYERKRRIIKLNKI